jgi:hypothetical protein
MSAEGEHVSQREFLERIIDELDSRYQQLLAERDARYQQQFTSAREAVDKAETSLREYKTSANEFRGTLADQAKTFVPRIEYESTIKELRAMNEAQAKLIVTLQLGESRDEGGSRATATSKSNNQWLIGLTVVVGLSVVSGIGSLIFFLVTRR